MIYKKPLKMTEEISSELKTKASMVILLFYATGT
jgi:hypothetical protein